MKIIQGDLIKLALEGQFDVIVHGCNCFHTMGAGIAYGIHRAFPMAAVADMGTAYGEVCKLGTCSEAICAIPGKKHVIVVNAYTQFKYGGLTVDVDYGAVRRCMAWIQRAHHGEHIGLPKIGAGLAGGDWPTIAAIIEEELEGEDVTLVEYCVAG